MLPELISIEESYSKHLKMQGVNNVLALNYDTINEEEQLQRDYLLAILSHFLVESSKWIISSLGPLEPYKNLGVLNSIADHEAQVAFKLWEVWRPDGMAPLAFSELSFEWS